MSQIKERPILFSAPMVRAILEDRKTVTRRPVKGTALKWLEEFVPEFVVHSANGLCPYGNTGDRLWVRETTEVDEKTSAAVRLARYSADGQPVIYRHPEGDEYDGSVAHWDYPRRSRPSIHMPRWASRILLEITAVRVERLQCITADQAKAEGVQGLPRCRSLYPDDDYLFPFKDLWLSINGAESWNANPWVWCVSFRRVEP
ncbi:hypothetical protein M1D68_16170 [Pseudomonas sp. R4-84]